MAFSKTKFELLLPELYGNIGNNLICIDNLNADLTNESAKKKFLAQMTDGVFRTNLNLEAKTGFTIGRFKAEAGLWSGASGTLGKAFTDLVFIGLDTDTEYSLSNTAASGLAAVTANLTYGHPIELENRSALGVGATLRLLKGLAVFDARIEDAMLKTNEIGESSYKVGSGHYYYGYLGKEGFNGFGILLDLGVVYRIDPWLAGVAFKNIGPAISWSGVTGESLSGASGDVVVAGPEGPEFFSENKEPEFTEFTSYKSNIPLVISAHGAYYIFPSLNVNLGIEKGFADGWGISRTPRLWAGLDWQARFLRLAGELSLQGPHVGIDTLAELRLFFLWLKLNLGWNGGFKAEKINGVHGAVSIALHF